MKRHFDGTVAQSSLGALSFQKYRKSLWTVRRSNSTAPSTPASTAVDIRSSLIQHISTQNINLKMAQNASTKFTDNYELKEELGK